MAAPDERSYRRGLILGLTMAEIMVLVLFALLLVWMAGLRLRRATPDELRVLKLQVAELQSSNTRLAEQNNRILGAPDKAKAFDDLFRELVIVRAKVKDLEGQVK